MIDVSFLYRQKYSLIYQRIAVGLDMIHIHIIWINACVFHKFIVHNSECYYNIPCFLFSHQSVLFIGFPTKLNSISISPRTYMITTHRFCSYEIQLGDLLFLLRLLRKYWRSQLLTGCMAIKSLQLFQQLLQKRKTHGKTKFNFLKVYKSAQKIFQLRGFQTDIRST